MPLLVVLSLLTVAPRFAVEAHGSLLNSGIGSPLIGLSTGWAVRGGAELTPRWGTFLHVEQSLWVGTETGPGVVPGTLSVGLGGEFRFADGFVRTSLAVGPSILLFDTLLDRAGRVGLFIDLRPVGLRWKLNDRFTIGLDPFHLVMLAPVLTQIPLVRVQYRLSLSLEFMP